MSKRMRLKHIRMPWINIKNSLRKFNRSRKVAKRGKSTGKINSRKVTVDGIKFASRLEAYMYKALKEAGIEAEYESESFEFITSI